MRMIETQCCIVGGGPAGVMLGFLLARAGVPVIVLEKHADFMRDFRGDTIHPSTLEILHELGLLEDFLKRPHDEAVTLAARMAGQSVMMADFSRLPTRCRFIAFAPQWEFLNFIAEQGRRYPSFHLEMQTDAVNLIIEGDRVVGVKAQSPSGPFEIRSALVVGADGRRSTVRERSGFAVKDLGAPMDVLWLRLPVTSDGTHDTLGSFENGHIIVTIYRGTYWQCGFVIHKGGFDEWKVRGLDALKDALVSTAPFLRESVKELQSWDQVKLLSVAVNRLQEWARPGLLCIGDAAHAMSPVGGVGINLAIQDAVATANLLTAALKRGTPTLDELKKVQQRRQWPTVMTQRMQLFIQKRLIQKALSGTAPPTLPLPFKLIKQFPVLRRLTARLIGLGFRPEHILQ